MPTDALSETFYDSQATWVLWLILIGSMGMLAVGADRTVTAAAALARALHVSKVVIGATVVSLGTTLPETCVSVVAAFKGDGSLALGNAVGSIIADTALIFGLCAAVTCIPKNRFVLNRHGWIQLGAGTLLAVLCFGLWALSGDIHNVVLPRAAGLGFIALLVGYIYLSVRWGRARPEPLPTKTAPAPSRTSGVAAAKNLLVLAVGLGLIVGGSELLIGSAKVVCLRYGVPPAVLAVTLVAFGTSLPEFVTAVAAVIKGHVDLSVGNIIGADILNVLFVTGAAATAAPHATINCGLPGTWMGLLRCSESVWTSALLRAPPPTAARARRRAASRRALTSPVPATSCDASA